MIEVLVTALLPLIKRIYQDAKAQNPYDPSLTDEELKAKATALLMADADALMSKSKAWLDAHPGL